MSLNCSGGLQKLGTICPLKIESQRREMSKNFPDMPYHLKNVFFSVKNVVQSLMFLLNFLYILPMGYVNSAPNGRQKVQNI
jgi:hypothetical protein